MNKFNYSNPWQLIDKLVQRYVRICAIGQLGLQMFHVAMLRLYRDRRSNQIPLCFPYGELVPLNDYPFQVLVLVDLTDKERSRSA